jgi:uncharacterized protein (DUF2461 family)
LVPCFVELAIWFPFGARLHNLRKNSLGRYARVSSLVSDSTKSTWALLAAEKLIALKGHDFSQDYSLDEG